MDLCLSAWKWELVEHWSDYRTIFVSLKQGKQYLYSEGKMDEESFIKFIEEGYKLAASQPVPPPVSKL